MYNLKRNIEIYQKSLINNQFVKDKAILSKKIKILFYYVVICILKPYCTAPLIKIHIINGKAELRLANDKNYENIYYGFTQVGVKDIFNQKTNISYFSRVERCKCFFLAIICFFRENLPKGTLIYWIDFCFWEGFFEKKNIEIVLSNGHYDRLTTLVSFLCQDKKILFYMKQHGFIPVDQAVPEKVHCDRVYVFDENEKKYFVNNVIENTNCEYVIQYQNEVTFENYMKDGILIGIIENQMEGMKKIIEHVISICAPNIQILVMMHPLSKSRFYKEFLDIPNVKFIKEKIWNLDFIVSGPSALVYDYLRNGYKGNIYFVDCKSLLPRYKNSYFNVKYIENLESLDEELKNQSELLLRNY